MATSEDKVASMTGHTASKNKSQSRRQRRKTATAKPKRDERMMGFIFPDGYQKDKSPLDYAVDPKTGMVQFGSGSTGKLWSVKKFDLRTGIDRVIIPCLYIWKKGKWLDEFDPDQAPIASETKEIQPKVLSNLLPSKGWAHNIWVVHGEGSPGANTFICYLLPDNECYTERPKHPLMWPEELRNGAATEFNATTHPWWASAPEKPAEAYHLSWKLLNDGFLSDEEEQQLEKPWTITGSQPAAKGWVSGGSQLTTVKPVSAVPKPVALPAGVRFRCGMCGHWWKESDLAAHAKVCAGTQGENGSNDWAIMCDKECGCEVEFGQPLGVKTLNHVSRCLPGYPPTPKVKEVKMDTETKDETAETVAEGADEASASTTEGADAPAEATETPAES